MNIARNEDIQLPRSYSLFLNTWSENSVSKISHHYQIPTSTLYSIIHKRDEIYSAASDLLHTNRNIYGMNAREMRFIQNYISPPKPPLTIKSISAAFFKEFGREIKRKDVALVLKNYFKFSYKKGSTAVPRSNEESYRLMRIYFSSLLLEAIMDSRYIINIDESSFNRDTIKRYSWLPKGRPNFILNLNNQFSWSLIMACWSDGEFLSLVVEETVDSDIYWRFLSILRYSLEKRGKMLLK